MAPLRLRLQRISRLLLLPLIVVLACAPATLPADAATATPGPVSSSRPLDLAAIAINPHDLNALGLQPYTTGDNRYLTTDAAANLIAEIQEKSPTDTSVVLIDAHFVLGYTLTNDNLTSPGDIGSNLNGYIQSTVLEFPDTPAAMAAYDSLITWPPTSGVAIDTSEPSVSDESQLVTYTSGGGESPSQQITQLTLRSDNLVAWIIFSARNAPTNAPALTSFLGQTILQKIAKER
ncbi:MAG: hypothetical protein ACR2OU_09510, partial [Thermomicrobiales bacterium]